MAKIVFLGKILGRFVPFLFAQIQISHTLFNILLTTQAACGWTVRSHKCVMRASMSTISHIFPIVTMRIIWTVILCDLTKTYSGHHKQKI